MIGFTSETNHGRRFKIVDFEPAAIQIRDRLATAIYWIAFSVVDRDGTRQDSVLRIIHTWQELDGKWQIVSGMSMPIPAIPR